MVLLYVTAGLGITWLTGLVFGIHPTWLHYVFGAVFATLPELDQIPWAKDIRAKSELHIPIVMILITTSLGILVSVVVKDRVWCLLGSACMTGHYIIDSIKPGPGIAWLAPLYPKHFHFIRFIR